jgi:RNA polymerase sigma factor (sigma-70 family)
VLVEKARAGDRVALEMLIRRHQLWIYNIARRMLYYRHDAEDATQEILIKAVTTLSTFQSKSSFRTWLYRVVVNHLLNARRERGKAAHLTFELYSAILDRTPNGDLPDHSSLAADDRLVIEEARIACTSGMLLCLDRSQRLVYILGEILGVTDVVAAELLELSRDNFRQRLTRARRDLHSFMQDKCGLVNRANPCRCHRKTAGFIQAGFVDPKELRFVENRALRVREVAEDALETLESLDVAYGAVYREHPFYAAPDFVESLRRLVDNPNVRESLEL